MGKTVTSYPLARGENSLESIGEAELPQGFVCGPCAEKMKAGRGRKNRLWPPFEVQHVSRPQTAPAVPYGQRTFKGCFPHQVYWSAGQLTLLWCDDHM